MTRHTIVLAEEKETIRRLVKKAIEIKPLGQEKIREILTMTDDATLVETLNRPNSPISILLLSTTFSTSSHQSLISNITERHPGIKVISLTHKYGDRSSMDYGAFESVDKPIRNPVLWERIDRAIESLESIEPNGVKQSRSIENSIELIEPPTHSSPIHEESLATVPVVDFSFHDEPEVEILPIPELIPIRNHSSSTPLLFSDDDSGDDDDLFGEPITSRKRANPVSPIVVEDVIVQSAEESHLDVVEDITVQATEETHVEVEFEVNAEQSPSTDYLFSLDTSDTEVEDESSLKKAPCYESTDIEVEVEVEAHGDELSFGISMDSTEATDSNDEPEPFDIEVIPEKTVEDANIFDFQQTEVNAIEKATGMEVDVVKAVEIVKNPLTMPVLETPPVNQPPTNKPPSDILEPNREINIETSSYNELSEWTLANEGFWTKKGDFVPLAPPRELMSKHFPSNGRLRKATAQKAEKAILTEGENLFSSVLNIFKKK